MNKKNRVITIDGPAGSGKSTVAKLVARDLNYLYLDTGALYRAVAYKVSISGRTGAKEEEMRDLLASTSICLKRNHDGLVVLVDNEDVSRKIRTEEIAVLASTASALPVIRKALLPIQRECAKEESIVAEGRDMGTVVFPQADFKFYLHATLEERARRRYLELIEKGLSPDSEEIRASIILRDKQDTERAASPLRISDDAQVIDTSELTIQEVLANILAEIRL
ncbi:MAG: (d)CMP kinase [Syntrophaceae bacterium]|nr:(d)CMP kinase [Syntrophaceae bacterium]